MAGPCVSQEVCHSATTVSVVWLLALEFIFTRCVNSLPRNFNVGCCANGRPLRSIPHRRVRFSTSFSSVEALLHLELKHWALAASYAEKKRPYDDVTGHLMVDNALHPSFLPGLSKVAEVAEPKSEGWAMRCQW